MFMPNHMPEGTELHMYACSFREPNVCILPHSRSGASHWVFPMVGWSHFWVTVMLSLSTASYCTLPISDTRASTLFTAPRNVKAGYPSLYKWEKWRPKMECRPVSNQTQCHSPCVWYLPSYCLVTVGVSFYALRVDPWPVPLPPDHSWVQGSELGEAWVKGSNKGWIFHPFGTQCLVL